MNIKEIKTLLDNLNCSYHFSYRTNKSFNLIANDVDTKFKSNTFPIYSITKTIIASLIFHSIENKKLKLEDKLSTFISCTNYEWLKNTTIAELLLHRSGLGDYGYTNEYKNAVTTCPSGPLSESELISIVTKQGQQSQTENNFLYSNIGYLFLKKILEKIYSKSFEELIEVFFIKKLQLKNTKSIITQEEFKSLTFPTQKSFYLNVEDAREIYHPQWVSHGLIKSTPEEITKVFNYIFFENFLSSKTLKTYTTLYKIPFNGKYFSPHYGYGILGDPNSNFGSYFGHDGNGPGYSAGVFINENKIFCLVLGIEGISSKDLIAQLITC
ncbi:serine hydrolase domain-containing protein [Halobacteriovorax sp. CON-3]|uniref:serine hydrolase domain-containing protein n=1 Tax=Halobacteriovorax sp. CON-3 TaxID=3157710 RepID=UPI0037168F6C